MKREIGHALEQAIRTVSLVERKPRMTSTVHRWLRRAVVTVVAVGVAIQFVPYGRDHTNPPVVASPPWPSAEAEALFQNSCADCHSNTTEWPLYSRIAPFSWLVRHDVDEGRHEMNASRWDEDAGRADKAAKAIADGEMPPLQYTLIHPDARLTDAEARVLIEAFLAMDD